MTKPREHDINFKPRVVGFICNWDAYSGLEMAGVKGKGYPADIELVRVICLGRLHLGLILKAFELGADGIMLLGCPPDKCHYESGAAGAKELFTQAIKVLTMLGIDPKRLALVEIPLGEGDFLAWKISSFVKLVRRIGSNKLKLAKKGLVGC